MGKYGEGEQVDHAVWDKLKYPARKMLELYDSRTPHLTLYNTTHSHNMRIIIEVIDWFLEHIDCGHSEKALSGLLKFAAIHYMTDAPYRRWFNAILAKFLTLVIERGWEFDKDKPYLWKE